MDIDGIKFLGLHDFDCLKDTHSIDKSFKIYKKSGMVPTKFLGFRDLDCLKDISLISLLSSNTFYATVLSYMDTDGIKFLGFHDLDCLKDFPLISLLICIRSLEWKQYVKPHRIGFSLGFLTSDHFWSSNYHSHIVIGGRLSFDEFLRKVSMILITTI